MDISTLLTGLHWAPLGSARYDSYDDPKDVSHVARLLRLRRLRPGLSSSLLITRERSKVRPKTQCFLNQSGWTDWMP